MAMPSSGTISLGNANTELGKASNALASLNDSNVRTLFGKASGAISLSDGYGKANGFGFNIAIAANTQNYNLKDAAIAAGGGGVVADPGAMQGKHFDAKGKSPSTYTVELQNGLRKTNNRVDYLTNLLPLKAEICLLELVQK